METETIGIFQNIKLTNYINDPPKTLFARPLRTLATWPSMAKLISSYLV